MRRPYGTLVAALVIAGCATEQETPPVEAPTGREVIDRLVEAAGGAETLDAVETLVVRYEFTDSRRDPVTREFTETGRIDVLQARDFRLGRSLYELQTAAPVERWERVVMQPGGAFRVDLLTGQAAVFAQGAASAAEYSGLLLRWYVYYPVTQARMAGPAVRFMGDTTINGQPHDIVAFADRELGDVRLYIDRDSSRLRMQRWQSADVSARLGSMVYEDYRDVGGIPIPFSVTVRAGTDQLGRYQVSEVQLNATLRDAAFEPPRPN